MGETSTARAVGLSHCPYVPYWITPVEAVEATLRWTALAAIDWLKLAYIPVPDVKAVPPKTKAEVEVVPVATDDVNVWEPVPVVKLIAAAPPLLPILVMVPEPFPIFKAVVAPPAKLMVVAVAFKRSNDVEPVVRLVATAGEVIDGVLLKTATPEDDPVSSERAAARAVEARAVVERFLLASVRTKLEAAKSWILTLPPAT